MKRLVFGLVTLIGLCTGQARAGIVYTGGTYSQNFNSLAATPEGETLPWTDNVTLPGWYSSRPIYRVNDGTLNNGDLYSYGGAGSSERALGSIASNLVGDVAFGIQLVNGTGVTINQFTLTYTGEQWRIGDQSVAQSLQFAYSVTATSLADGAYTNNSPLSFSSLKNNGPTDGTALDGNAAGNRTVRTATVTGLGWAPGTSLWLRWADTNNTQADNGMAVDDLTFATPVPAVPEPGTMPLLGLGALGMLGYRFKRPKADAEPVAAA